MAWYSSLHFHIRSHIKSKHNPYFCFTSTGYTTSTSLSVDEKLGVVLKSNHEISISNQELKAQDEYLRKQLGTFLKQEPKINKEAIWFSQIEEEEASNPSSSSSKDEPKRMTKIELRFQAHSNDFRVEIPKFEGKLDPDE